MTKPLQTAVRNRVPRFVFLSSTVVYGVRAHPALLKLSGNLRHSPLYPWLYDTVGSQSYVLETAP